jgi:serine/threonine protein kinase
MNPDDATVTAGPTVLQAGRQFGVYRVEALLGAGGMGHVFRAVDTRLNRPVAIKVCEARFGERFDREVRAISALNHPHICTLYDIGPDYLVMELIDGETLTVRLRKGPLPMEDVLQYGAQIADALTEAHRAGIVHRDLKPGNVMLTRHGMKVLDFGLAKMTETPEPTLTQPFAVMGTPAYMAPEQAAGAEAGPPSDLFALGLLLYEMTTGQRPLPGASLGRAMLGGGITTVTPPSRIRAETTPALDALVARLLTTDPSQRPGAAAVADELRALVVPKSRGIRIGVVASAATVLALAVAASWWLAGGTREPTRLEVASIVSITNLPGNKLDPAYSPDGSAIAFSWRGNDGNSPGIYVLDANASMPRRLSQSGFDDMSPAWSPDGTDIAFERVKPSSVNELIVIRAAGGPERKLRDVRQSVPLYQATRPLLTWTPDGGAIVIPTLDVDADGRASLFRIGLRGEPPQRLFGSTGGDGDSYPALSPDGHWLAYGLAERGSARLFVRRMGSNGLPDGPPQEVPGGAGTAAAPIRSPMWSPDSARLVFAAGARLLEWEVGGGSRELWVSGDRFQVLTPRWTGGVISQLVYAKVLDRRELRELRLDPSGRQAEGPPREFMRLGSIGLPQFSPDGRWLTFSDGATLRIAKADGSNPRLLAALWPGSGVHISPDSRHVAFHKVDEIFAPLYVVDLDENGAAAAVRKVAQAQSFSLAGASWSADGTYLYTTAINKTPQRVIRARVTDGELEELFDGATPVVAPDGHRVFYRKGLGASALFARSLDGDIARNPEEQLVPGCVLPFGLVPTAHGIYYVACDEQRQPVTLSYFEFSSRRSFDLGPAPLGTQPILTVSPDGRRLVYQTSLPDNGELTRVTFRLTGR